VRPPPTNPFSTRYTRPGVVPPLDADGAALDVDGLIVAFDRSGRVAAIVGPHGSGKSTLLVHVASALARQGRQAVVVRVRSWRDVPRLLRVSWTWSRHGVLCVDSWESLGLAGGVLRRLAHMTRRGLLVTSHERAGFPELIRTGTSERLLRVIVEGLPDSAAWFGESVLPGDVTDAFVRSGGDLRDALGSLYDLFERRVRQRQHDPAAAAPVG
jgi:energy-coupling factor transporter ATP-binding protein EcfA2